MSAYPAVRRSLEDGESGSLFVLELSATSFVVSDASLVSYFSQPPTSLRGNDWDSSSSEMFRRTRGEAFLVARPLLRARTFDLMRSTRPTRLFER